MPSWRPRLDHLAPESDAAISPRRPRIAVASTKGLHRAGRRLLHPGPVPGAGARQQVRRRDRRLRKRKLARVPRPSPASSRTARRSPVAHHAGRDTQSSTWERRRLPPSPSKICAQAQGNLLHPRRGLRRRQLLRLSPPGGRGQPVIVMRADPRRPELHGKILLSPRSAPAVPAIVVAEAVDEFAEGRLPRAPCRPMHRSDKIVLPLQIFACELATVRAGRRPAAQPGQVRRWVIPPPRGAHAP